jgi:mxaL protein
MTAKALFRGAVDKDSGGLLAALLLLLAALFLPAVEMPRDTYDWIVFIDITQSMNVEDYELDGAPVSRVDYARQATRRALRDLPCGSRLGLGAFADYRTLMLLAPIEVCSNYNDLLVTLDYIDGRMRWRNASEIAKGVSWGIRGAREIGGGANVVFLTDGHEAPPLRPSVRPTFDDVKPGEVRGWIVGVGGDTPRPIPKTDREGNPAGYWREKEVIQRIGEPADAGTGANREHLSALHEPHLQAIAQQVGFEYARLIQPSALSEAMRDSRFARRGPVPTDIYWVPAAVALLLLALRFRPDLNRAKPARVKTPEHQGRPA